MAHQTVAHALMNYQVLQFGRRNYENADMDPKGYLMRFSEREVIKCCNPHISSAGDAGAVTLSLSESNLYLVISKGDYIQGQKLTGLPDFDFLLGDGSLGMLGSRDTMHLCHCGLLKASLR